MSKPDSSSDLRLRVLTAVLIGFLALAIGHSALLLPEVGARGVLVDFDAFYLVGEMARDGRITEAYDMAAMAAVQRGLVGHEGFMPWTYPPPFDLLTMVLPTAPRWLAYALFTALTLGLYLWVLARLAGRWFLAVLIALLPPIYVSVTIGQNAFLTGGLMGLYCLAALAGRGAAAGWPLGLLVIKPHLGIGLAVQALAARRWRVLALAVALALALCAAATLVLGLAVWPAFLGGVEQAGVALRAGFYPLFRMTSVYALLHTLGLDPAVAATVQGLTALAACGVVAALAMRGAPLHQTLAAACFASALVSPYLYDYDMTITGAGIALVIGDLMRRSTRLELGLLLALLWVAGGWGMIHALASAGLPWEDRAAIARATLSYGAVAYLLVLGLFWRILRRPPRPD